MAVRLAGFGDPQHGFKSQQFNQLMDEDWVLEANWVTLPVIDDRSMSELLASQSLIRLLAQRLQE